MILQHHIIKIFLVCSIISTLPLLIKGVIVIKSKCTFIFWYGGIIRTVIPPEKK